MIRMRYIYLEIFDLKTHKWSKQVVSGDIPSQCRGSFHAVVGNTLYLFGGYNENGFSNSLYALNLDTFKWSELDCQSCVPTPKFLGRMVAFGKRLVTFGGCGVGDKFNEDLGAEFLPDDSFGNFLGSGWNNALHEYNI